MFEIITLGRAICLYFPYFNSNNTIYSGVLVPTRPLLVFSLYMDISGAASVAQDAVCCKTVVGSLRSYNLDVNNSLN